MADRTIRTYLRVEVADAKRELRSIAAEADKTGAAFDASGKRIETTSGRLVRSARVNAAEWRTVGTTLATLGTVGVAALGASAAAAISWESAWTGVLKTVDGTNAQLSTLEEGLRRMATELPSTHTEIAAVAEAAGQLGVGVEDVQAFTRTMIDLGETTNLSAEEAATGLARFANVMGTSQSDISRLGSTIVGLGNNFATTEREILDMAQRLSAAGAVVGMSESDILGLSAAMSSVGIEAEAGGSAISRVMIAVSKAVDGGGSKLDSFARIANTSSEKFAQAWREDSADALVGVVQGLARLSDAGESAFGILDELGLKDVRVTNAMLSLANASELTGDALGLANEEWASNTALVEEASKRYDTVDARMRIARNTLNNAAIDLGSHMLPALSGLADGVAGVAEWFGRLPDPAQRAAAGLGGVASVAALGAGSMALLVPKAIETIDAFQTLGVISPKVHGGLTRIGGAALRIGGAAVGIGLVGTAIAKIAESTYLGRIADDMGSVAEIAAEIAEAGKTDALSRLFRGTDGDALIDDVNDLASAVERTFNKNWEQSFNDWGSSLMNSLTGVKGSTEILADAWDRLDRQLVDLTSGGNAELAATMFDAVNEAMEMRGVDTSRIGEVLPNYVDQIKVAESETRIMSATTREAVDVMELYLESIGLTADQFSSWQTVASDAAGAFIDLTGAYDSVIEKNRQIAQSTADATKSSKDSWEDYYDGSTVKIADFIKDLEEQAEAKRAWEEDMLALAERVDAEMVTYLSGLGQQGSPLVDMLVGAEDDELARIEKLFAEGGVLATEAFANELAEATFGSFPIEADTTPAIAEIDELIAAYHGRAIEMQVKAELDAGAIPNAMNRLRDWLFSGGGSGVQGESAAAGAPAAPAPAHARVAPPMWGGPAPQVVSQPAQAAMYGNTTSSQGQVMVLREHTVERTTVHVDKLVAQDVEDFTEQASALRRGAAVAGMRAV